MTAKFIISFCLFFKNFSLKGECNILNNVTEKDSNSRPELESVRIKTDDHSRFWEGKCTNAK